MKPMLQTAPDAMVTLWDGSTDRLSRYWEARQLVLVFLRHLG